MNLCAAKAKIEYSTFRKMSEQSKAQNNITKASAAVKVLQVARNWKSYIIMCFMMGGKPATML